MLEREVGLLLLYQVPSHWNIFVQTEQKLTPSFYLRASENRMSRRRWSFKWNVAPRLAWIWKEGVARHTQDEDLVESRRNGSQLDSWTRSSLCQLVSRGAVGKPRELPRTWHGEEKQRDSLKRERDSTSGHVKITCLYKTRGILIHFCTGRSSGYYLCWLGIKEG